LSKTSVILLHAAIGILLVAVAGLDEAHWHADDEFATTRLLVARRERALAQQIKFIFVEASLRDGDILPRNSPLTF